MNMFNTLVPSMFVPQTARVRNQPKHFLYFMASAPKGDMRSAS